jgi:hypothetical protein
MRCREAELWISVRIDGETVPQPQAQALEMHVASCSSCSRVLADLETRARLLSEALSSGDTAPLSRAVLDRLASAEPSRGFESVARPFGRQPWSARSLRWAAASAAAAVALILAWPDGRPGGQGGPDGPRGGVTSMPVSGDGGPPRITLELEDFRRMVVPALDGSPMEKEVRETRQFIFDRGEKKSGFDLDERRHFRTTEYQRLVDFPYR